MASNNIYNPRACGQLVPSVEVNPLNIIARRAPTTSDNAVIGQIWINKLTNTVYQLTSFSSGNAIWTSSVASSGGVFSAVEITGGAGDVLTIDMGNVVITDGNLTMTGNASVDGNLDVTGDVTVTGDFDITSAAAISFTTTDNVAGAITLATDGGTSETILLHAIQGTSSSSIDLVSDVGGITLVATANATDNAIVIDAPDGGINMDGALQININSSQVASDAIFLNASNAAGGVLIVSGTAGLAFTADNGPVAIESGTGAITIGTDATAKAVTIGSTTAGTTMILHTATSFVLDGSTATTYAVGASTTTGTITIGGTAQSGTMTLGSSSATNIVNIGAGTGATTVNIADGITNAKTITVGTGAAMANTITIGGTGANVITIGNTQTAGSVAIGAAMTTGTVSIGGTGLQTGTVSIAPGTGAQTVNIATGGTGVKTTNIATGAIGNVTTIGTTTTASSLSLLAPAEANGGVQFTSAAGTARIMVGTGVPGNGLAIAAGDMFIRLDPAGATSRLYIATAASTWTNVTCAA